MALKVLYEDRDLIVCEKPVGVLSQKGKENENDMLSLLDRYFAQKGEKNTAYVLHRLDAGVGGVMVYAKHKKAAAAMSTLISSGEMNKEYFAVVEGELTDIGEEGEFFDLLFKDSAKNKSYVVKTKRKGVKEARLAYRTLGSAQREGKRLSLVRVRLYTGRTHQIRVQFASRSHPLLGDGRYGSRGSGDTPALFSAELSFVHPFLKKEMTFSLGLPQGQPWDAFNDFVK